VLLQIDLDLSMRAGKRAQVLGQELHDGREVGVHAHMAAHALGVLGEFALHALQAEQHGACVVQQALARGCGGDTAAAAPQQRRAHHGFEIGQALAHRRGGDVFLLRRAADAAEFAHGDEELQRGQVDAARETALGAFHRWYFRRVWRWMTVDYLLVRAINIVKYDE